MLDVNLILILLNNLVKFYLKSLIFLMERKIKVGDILLMLMFLKN